VSAAEHLEAIRAALVSRLQAVPEIGVVHGYQRYTANLRDMPALYTSEIGGVRQLRGWYVSRKRTEETSRVPGAYAVTHEWEIRGYMALLDAAQSEIVFDGLVERIREVFRGEDALGGLVGSIVFDEEDGSQAGVQAHLEPVMFAGVLCHAARLSLRTRTWFRSVP